MWNDPERHEMRISAVPPSSQCWERMTTASRGNDGPLAQWPLPADEEQAQIGFERWRNLVLENRDPIAFANSPQGHATLSALFGNSPYLSHLACKHPGLVIDSVQSPLENIVDGLIRAIPEALPPTAPEHRIMGGLRQKKAEIALAIALGDLSGRWPLEKVVGALSQFAERAVQTTVHHLLADLAAKGILRLGPDRDPMAGTGFIVLGMGKLGARELNYSSDIDLILFYDPDAPGILDRDRLPMAMNRVARGLVKILEERTAEGYVFRTDLRLRPDPGATPPAVSLPAAENYYASLAQTWERSAMIKARPIAGDLRAGADFLSYLKSFVWPRSLDFGTLSDMAGVKRRIHASKGHSAISIAGHDVKLGRGGIREIEFFAQSQQLLFGGRRPDLRVRGTLAALDRLVVAGYLALDERHSLERAYRFLRKVEHRLQMIDDQQTQTLPKTPDKLATFATFMGYETVTGFQSDLSQVLHQVATCFDRLFATCMEDAEDSTESHEPLLVLEGVDDDPQTLEVLTEFGYRDPSQVLTTVRGWLSGRYRSLRTAVSRQGLKPMIPMLLRALADTPEPDATFRRFDTFLSHLPSGAQLFALLRANSDLVRLLANILGTAPALADHLEKNPALMDSVLTPGFFDRLPDIANLEADLARLTGDQSAFEPYLEALVRFTEDERFRGGLHLLGGIALGDETGPFFSALAELAIRSLLPRTLAKFAEAHGHIAGGEIAVVAMGKLGGREMSPGSDLDLILIYNHSEGVTASDGPKPLAPTVYYTRLTQRLIGALSALTPQGRLYEVDMRLRPSGNAGPVATHLQAFHQYQQKDAWTWEHMALTRARVVSGPRALTLAIVNKNREILSQSRDTASLREDILEMRRKIAASHPPAGPLDVKYRRGGLVDIEFTTQYLQLKHAQDLPDILSPSTQIALRNLMRNRFLARDLAEPMLDAHRLWQRLQTYLRLTQPGLTGNTPLPAATRAGILKSCLPHLGPDASDPEILRGMEALGDRAAKAAEEIFGEALS